MTAAVLALLVLAAPASSRSDVLEPIVPEDVGLSSERLERLSGTLQRYVDSNALPGAVVLIARQGGLAFHEEFGLRDREIGAAMRPDTIFRIASQTKALVSVGIMLLQEDGRLLLSDPVGKYLPEFQETTVAVPDGTGGYDIVTAERPITLRDLLTHTAGIGYGTGIAADRWEVAGITGWYFADRDEPIAATVSRMAGLPFEAQPGERWVYGYATDILGVLIEQLSGQSLDSYLRQRLFEPLGMSDTHFFLPPAKRERLAAVYSIADDGSLQRAPDSAAMLGQGAYVDGPRQSFSGGAGLVSTASDYARFLQMLLNGGELDGVRLLSRKTVELMTVSHTGHSQLGDNLPGAGFGLGFYVVQDLGGRGQPGSVGEFGWGGAYHTSYWVDPAEELVVVYLTQVNPATGLDDQEKVRALVYQAIVD
ncbi:MAG: serine hydrolase domain-containing protein [Pseudomonadota bacterium]